MRERQGRLSPLRSQLCAAVTRKRALLSPPAIGPHPHTVYDIRNSGEILLHVGLRIQYKVKKQAKKSPTRTSVGRRRPSSTHRREKRLRNKHFGDFVRPSSSLPPFVSHTHELTNCFICVHGNTCSSTVNELHALLNRLLLIFTNYNLTPPQLVIELGKTACKTA